MDRTQLDKNIEAIRKYTAEYAELRAAHHFLYDLPLDKSAGRPELVVMGINPGETLADKSSIPGPTEETSQYDFHEKAESGRSKGSKHWRKLTAEFTGGRPVVFSELFSGARGIMKSWFHDSLLYGIRHIFPFALR